MLGTSERIFPSQNYFILPVPKTVPFPPGYAATVHFYWPGKGFQLLGMYVFGLQAS
jgi:hypothetical protein